MTNCGPGGSGAESCCTSLDVTGGTFYRTYSNDGGGPAEEAEPATVSTFRLDKYLVTVGRFRQFVNAVLPPDGGTGWLPTAGSGKHTHLNGGQGLVDVGDPADAGTVYEPGWATSDNSNIAPTNDNLACDMDFFTWTPLAGNQENIPINCVNWYEAYAFCIWDGGFLPSEAEWEYAAAGGSEEQEYPWGSAAPGTGNQYAIYGCYYPSGSGSCSGVVNIAPVGLAASGAGLWGQLDLAGEVWEWNLDWYATYATCTDCANFTGDSFRVARGGDFLFGPPQFLPPARYYVTPADRGLGLGLRCSRTP
jgi:formylglycine-generating enzyme required for sulfatase activity